MCNRHAFRMLLLVLGTAAWARGDGGMFAVKELGVATPPVASPKQEALMVVRGKEIEITLRTQFLRGPKELAWIVPLPARPENVKEGKDSVFAALAKDTTPRFYEVRYQDEPFWAHLMCACGAQQEPNAPIVTPPPVSVEETGLAGVFDYTVLSARDAGKLVGWLKEHGYHVPPRATEMFRHYVRQGWHWLAMRIRPEVAQAPTLAPHPIVYTYRADRVVYPMVISRLSAAERTEVILYVLAEKRMASANWTTTQYVMLLGLTGEGKRLQRQAGTPSGTNYEQLLGDATAREGGHLFVTEFAGDIDTVGYRPLLEVITGEDPLNVDRAETFLTRLRAVVCPGAMDRDVELVPRTGPPELDRVDNSLYLSAAAPSHGTLAMAMPLMVIAGAMGTLVVGVRLTGATGWRKGVGAVCLMVGCAVLTMV